ncbi:MAG: membrane protein insertion efficiency factor YidD [Clostridiaceae bacterium]
MKKIIIVIIRFYQKKISPNKKYLYYMFGISNPGCKYYPTCSEYAIIALNKYGIFRGSILSIWRILRCNPFSNGGYDPVK